ncbi:hypothetical protein ACFYV7_14950 [Nocardia suismassiliense]|uniref:DUF222 domain-containing protein n=1 Tax=Nocardia suismassiliense TaxID=2077092 RepID=A0ABW6QTZ1_9NOCA
MPTAVQQRLLKQLQNVTADLDHVTGSVSDRQLMRDLDTTARLLQDQAREIGIPPRWIAFVRAQGNAGHRWSDGQQLPASTAEAREHQLARLHTQVDQLYEMAALRRTYRERGNRITPLAAERFSEHQRLQWLRITMVSRALNVTRGEVGTRWSGDPQRWTALLEATRALTPSELSKRWKSYTTATAVVHARLRESTLRTAGLDSFGAVSPPRPHELHRTAATVWRAMSEIDSPPSADVPATNASDPGAQITAAVEAAAPEPSLADEPDTDDPAPASVPQIAAPQRELEL